MGFEFWPYLYWLCHHGQIIYLFRPYFEDNTNFKSKGQMDVKHPVLHLIDSRQSVNSW